MREPGLVDSSGIRTPYSQASSDRLQNVVAGRVLQAASSDFGSPLPPDSDFRERYAAILLRERGF
jgi:hypothetical protein